PKRSTPSSRQRSMKESDMGVAPGGQGLTQIPAAALSPSERAFANRSYNLRMRIITLNANGIRSAGAKGVFPWLRSQEPDVVCIQETKCQNDQIAHELYHPKGYHCYYFDAQKKGYSGVALYSKRKPDEVIRGYGSREFDQEGRYLEARFGKL